MARWLGAAMFISTFWLSACATRTALDYKKDRLQIRDEIRQQASPVRGCYDGFLKLHPKAEGKVVIDFEITDQGAVQNQKVEEIHPSLVGLEECIYAVFAKMTFKKPALGEIIEVAYPFCFSSGTGNDCFDRFKTKEKPK